LSIAVEKLSNGFEIVMEKKKSPVSAFSIGFKSGSLTESRGMNGSTHFLEHMLLRDSSSGKREWLLKKVAERGGRANGSTSPFSMQLNGVVLNEDLDFLMELETGSIKQIKFNKEDVEKEKEVILQELALKKERVRKDSVFLEWLIKGYSPFKTLGQEEDIKKMTFSKVKKRLNEIRKPNNMHSVIIGNFNEREVVDFFENELGSLKKGKTKQVKNFKLKKGEKGIVENEVLKKPKLYFSYVARDDKENHFHSIIFRDYLKKVISYELRDKRSLIYSTISRNYGLKNGFVQFFSFSLEPEKIGLAEKIIKKEIEKIQQGKIKKKLFNATKKAYLMNSYLSEQSFERRINTLRYFSQFNDLNLLAEKEEIVKKISEKELIENARSNWDEQALSWLIMNPLKK